MMPKPIQFENLSLSFPHKICFTDFSGQIPYGSRIAIIGRNGSGKSTLLKSLAGLSTATEGAISYPKEFQIAYVPQIIDVFDSLSGGQRFNKLLSQALASMPDALMLDEPSNHLDKANRRSLMRMLANFGGTLILVTHDVELLEATVDTIWHIDNWKIHVFSGSYQDYMREKAIQRAALEEELNQLSHQKKQLHMDLMKEQERAKKSRQQGEKNLQQRKWPTIVSGSKARRSQETSGQKKSAIHHKKQDLAQRLSELHVEEIIQPKFDLRAVETNQALVTVHDGTVSYNGNDLVLKDLNFTIKARERIAIHGANGSGKSTLIKAIFNGQSIIKGGEWNIPQVKEIGYLDQHYNNLAAEQSVYDTLSCILPHSSHNEIRKHLNDFLFRKNEEIEALVSTLSGGEKARLSLAQIAAITPKLLILDEMTNNLDRETRDHVIQVLQAYPGALIVISHDCDFLTAIGITNEYEIKDGVLI